MQKVIATNEAIELIKTLKQIHGEILFNISGGCCDGTSAMCYKKGDFLVPLRNVKLGEIEECEIFIDSSQNEYFSHSQIIIDAKKQNSFGNSFSLEIDLGYSFLVKSEIIN